MVIKGKKKQKSVSVWGHPKYFRLAIQNMFCAKKQNFRVKQAKADILL